MERALRTTLDSPGTILKDEYTERDDVVLISQIEVDEILNEKKVAEMTTGLKPVVKDFHTNKAQGCLLVDKKGSLESLVWRETTPDMVPITPGIVDV